ncbi:redoxin domain-containing protein [Polaribacter sp. Z014]|uniref:redoxin domain-containing protein n=1 Tax=Polaribacter sp. Z014 TaxID=2927126 RepID=UPI002020576C|nr:redoxin domain-containing protein [Polaribacter sp. Z014]MCL7765463.1 redoxin domain-containing protein [Polaribacter sp. Z014]
MKKKILITILFFTVSITFGQDKIITRKFTTTQVEKIDFTKIYNKKTGKKIKKDDFIKIVGNNPNLQLEEIIGVDGKIDKYLVNLSKKSNSTINNRKNVIVKGELFPNFIAQTINKRKIELNKLRGKIVILRFELEANSFRFKKQEIKQIDNLINKVKNKREKVKAIIFFASNELDIKKGFDLTNSNFELIPNGLNFQEKFSITRFPTTIVIDENGKLVEYYNFIDDMNLNNLITE